MIIGAHVRGTDPIAEADAAGAECIQLFVGPPQSWKKPPPREDAEILKASSLPVYVHAPYPINVASPNNRVRIPSRKILSNTFERAEEIGAAAVIVHAGHAEDGIHRGFMRWRKVFEEIESPVPLLIENTAGGDNAMARRLERIARLWDAIGQAKGGDTVGFCLDTCHAHAGGEDLVGLVDRVMSITGHVDLVHANDSRDPFDSGADRHANFGDGEVGTDALAEVVRTAAVPVVVETPGGREGQGADIAWLKENV